jgi:hypothetical protein
MRVGLLICGMGGALGACATSGPAVEAVGPGPDLAGSSSFSLDFARLGSIPAQAGAAESGDQIIPAIVAKRLSEKGLVAATTSPARYLVEIGYGGRPVTVGAYVDAGPAGAPEVRPNWLEAPERAGRAQICTLTMRITEMATDKEVFRVRAAGRGDKAGCASAAPRLVETAVAKLQPAATP